MKKTAFVAAFVLPFIASAQSTILSRVIVASGGIFEFSAPYVDRATVGSYDPINKNYTVFDTIQVESVQAVDVDGDFAFVAAQDSIIKYDLVTLQRAGETGYAGIRTLTAAGDKLVVGKYYGSGPYVSILNKNSLTLLAEIPQIQYTVHSIAISGDSAYVAYNLPGTVDLYPPFGIYSDSLGLIGVIDLKNGTFVRNIELGEEGAGVGKLFIENNMLYAVATGTGNVFAYDIANSQMLKVRELGVTAAYDLYNSSLFGQFGFYGLSQYDLVNEVYHLLSDKEQIITAKYDPMAGDLYFTQSNYSTYGSLLVMNSSGIIDSIPVGISPEALDFYVTVVVNTNVSDGAAVKVYPNPSSGIIKISSSEDIYSSSLADANGRTVTSFNGNYFDGSALPAGMYVLSVSTQSGISRSIVVISR